MNAGQNSLSASEGIVKEKAALTGLGSNNALGNSMCFQQFKTSEVVKIWWGSGPPPRLARCRGSGTRGR